MSKRKMKKSITFGNVLVVLAQLFLLACTSIFLFQNKVSVIRIMNKSTRTYNTIGGNLRSFISLVERLLVQ